MSEPIHNNHNSYLSVPDYSLFDFCRYGMTDEGRIKNAQYLASYAAKGQMPEAEIRKLCTVFLLCFPNPCMEPDLDSELDEVLSYAYGIAPDSEAGLTERLREWITQQNETFRQRESYEIIQELNKRNIPKEKAKIRTILNRMAQNKDMIEKAGRGEYRIIDCGLELIDPYECDLQEFDIKYPLDIHNGVITMPKNLIVVAGEPQSGKTAFCMNVARLNMNQGKRIRYASSEMGKFELHVRLRKFEKQLGIPLDDWKGGVQWVDRSTNYQDVILENDITIIDYLEMHDNFYEIGGILRGIYERLDNGVAIVAIQKAGQAEYGRGGAFGLEKPRLYITLAYDPIEGNTARIVKAKNFRQHNVNPNHRICHFKLVEGCEFMKLTDWVLPPKKGR